MDRSVRGRTHILQILGNVPVLGGKSLWKFNDVISLVDFVRVNRDTVGTPSGT